MIPAKLDTKEGALQKKTHSGLLLLGITCYVAVVLTVDALASLRVSWFIDWTVFRWHPVDCWRVLNVQVPNWLSFSPWNSFDLFKFLFWFLIPFCFCLPKMEWSWFSFRGWKRVDWMLLAVFLGLGSLSVLSVAFIPSLRQTYLIQAALSWEARSTIAMRSLVWMVSWILGWEFLHRYVLLRIAVRKYATWGWVLIPLSEVLYHLQKPLIEALGMGVFSVVLTLWSMKRKNMLLPFLIHLYIELFLIGACLFVL
ncbi:MAG: hypothetical protein WCX86_11835 [Candidatus Hydrogenedentales bacterium]